MRRISAILSCICIMSALSACTDFEEDWGRLGVPRVDLTEINAIAEESKYLVTVTCKEEWEITSIPDWITIEIIDCYYYNNADDGNWNSDPRWKVLLSLRGNSGFNRIGIIVFASKSGKAEVKVAQSGAKWSGPAEAIDMGLSVKWASFNIGASQPEEYGCYFAWGETTPKENYSWTTYLFRDSGDSSDNVTFSKYNTQKQKGILDNKTVLDYSDDAARVNWGGGWRMPTDKEALELKTNCIWIWSTLNGKNGYLVKSKVTGNSIFLPTAGWWGDTTLNQESTNGSIWTSTLYQTYPYRAFALGFNTEKVDIYVFNRSNGSPIRPVID